VLAHLRRCLLSFAVARSVCAVAALAHCFCSSHPCRCLLSCLAVLSRCFILLLSCVDVRSWRGGGLIAQAPVHPIRAISVWPLPSPRAKRVWGSPRLRGSGGAPPKSLCFDPARGDALQGLKLPLQVLCPHSFTKSLSSQRAKTSRAQMHSPASPPYRLIDRTEC
jgi:hypothetical protein